MARQLTGLPPSTELPAGLQAAIEEVGANVSAEIIRRTIDDHRAGRIDPGVAFWTAHLEWMACRRAELVETFGVVEGGRTSPGKGA
jgi:hypothetical protein